ncbi:MAG: helix-turn-helix domain-containing protein [Chloroflexi bacterium]|nr:helix-turn-helix domain-containing protein [Chloroflexota bacterium]
MKSQNIIGQLPQRLLKVDEVSEILNISRSQVYKLIAIKEIQSVRIGKSVRIRPIDLREFIDMKLMGPE